MKGIFFSTTISRRLVSNETKIFHESKKMWIFFFFFFKTKLSKKSFGNEPNREEIYENF